MKERLTGPILLSILKQQEMWKVKADNKRQISGGIKAFR